MFLKVAKLLLPNFSLQLILGEREVYTQILKLIFGPTNCPLSHLLLKHSFFLC